MYDYEDRRILKTKHKIILEFAQLLRVKTFQEITIAQICQKAQISRTTFYKHFKDKESIVKSFQNEISREILKVLREPHQSLAHLFEQMVTIWDKYYDILKSFMTSEYSREISFQTEERLKDKIKDQIIPAFMSDKMQSTIDTDYLATFYTGAFYAMLKKWLTDKEKLPKEEFLKRCHHVLECHFN